jgi:hypothetical protein
MKSQRRHRTPPGRIATLGQIARDTSWVWARCPNPCLHEAAIPLAPIIGRFGANASSDRLRNALHCTACGRRGALLQHPSWGMAEGYRSAPLDRVPDGLRRQMAREALRSIGIELA